MVDTELTIEERNPPSTVVSDANLVTGRGPVGRVKVEPDGSGGWRVIADGNVKSNGNGKNSAPSDVPPDQWNPPPGLGKDEFDTFGEEIKALTKDRKQITTTHSRAASQDHWRITINYDDERGP